MDWCSARYIILVMCGQHGLTGRDDDDLLCDAHGGAYVFLVSL